jgi:hypothetical protein
MRWLDECSPGAVAEALRAVAPELSGGEIVVRETLAEQDPQWWAASATLGEHLIVKFAWSKPAALRLTHEITVLTALTNDPDGPESWNLAARENPDPRLAQRVNRQSPRLEERVDGNALIRAVQPARADGQAPLHAGQPERADGHAPTYAGQPVRTDGQAPTRTGQPGREETGAVGGRDDPTAAPGRDDPTGVPGRDDPTVVPRRDDLTGLSGRDDLTVAPERDDPTAAPGRADPTVVPGRDDSTVVPGRDDFTGVSGRDHLIVVPGRDDTTVAPERGDTTVVPERRAPTFVPEPDRLGGGLSGVVAYLPDVVASSTDPVLLVTRRVPGQTLFEVVDSIDRDDAGRQLARFLAGLHHPATLERVEQLVGGLPPALLPPATTDTIRDGFVKWVRPDQVESVVRWCDWAAEVLAEPAPAVLVHGDLHGGNQVWEGGKLRAVVDFETAGTADAEYDLRAFPGTGPGVELFLSTAHHYRQITGRALSPERVMAWHVRTALGDALWRSEAGVPLPDHRTPIAWVDDLATRFAALHLTV